MFMLRCEPNLCGVETTPQTEGIQHGCDGIKVGETCVLWCIPGFSMTNYSTVTYECAVTGNFIPETVPIACYRDCVGDPAIVSGQGLTGSGQAHGSTRILGCAPGYRLADDSSAVELTCVNGTWETGQVTCVTLLPDASPVGYIELTASTAGVAVSFDNKPAMGACEFDIFGIYVRESGTEAWSPTQDAAGNYIPIATATLCDSVVTVPASILPTDTDIDVTMKVLCKAGFDSTLAETATVGTYPAPSLPPSVSSLTSMGSDHMFLAGTLMGESGSGDCTHLAVIVEFQEVSEDDLTTAMTPWTETGCLEENGGCSVYGLRCGTYHRFRLLQLCTDPRANSDISERFGPEVTLSDGCNRGADAPILTVAQYTETSNVLTWDVPSFGDCRFLSYDVRVDEINDKTGAFSAKVAYGCLGPFRRDEPTCYSHSLRSFRAYRYSVRVACVDDAKSGPYSEQQLQRTMPRLPEPPTNVRFVSGTVVQWDLGELNDCIFTKYQIDVQEGAVSFVSNGMTEDIVVEWSGGAQPAAPATRC
jgi:hypothetical protein